MTEKTLTTENIKPALDALRGELAPWPVVAKKQDRLNTAQLNAANSGITSSLVAQIIANTAAIRALESAITGTGLRALVVASLPAVGTTGILYIVPVTTYDPDTDADVVNYSNEYIWIPVEGGTASEGHYEQVGQTGIVINNGQLTITVNGTSVGTFTANQSGDTTAAITVPTNADYVDRTTDQTVAGVKTFSSTINGTASKAIADEDGTSIKTGYVNVAGNQAVTGQKTWSGENLYTNNLNVSGFRIRLYDSTDDWTVTPTNAVIREIDFTDKNNSIISYFAFQHRSNTTEPFRTCWRQNKKDGTTDYYSVNFNNLGEFYPEISNTKLGTSSNQWASVYAQSYYYNGAAWGLDKANVWSAENTYTYVSLTLKHTALEAGVLPASNQTKRYRFTDKNNVDLGWVQHRVNTSGESYIELYAVNKFDNSQLSPQGAAAASSFAIGLKGDGTRFANIMSNLYPASTNTYALGSSSYQWSSVYAQTYYYNGTAWGLDKANVWTESQTYSSDSYGEKIRLKNTGLDLSVNGNTGLSSTYQHMIHWTDKNNTPYSTIQSWTSSTENVLVLRSRYRTDANTVRTSSIRNQCTATAKRWYPESDADTDLGSTGNRWKTLNGVNPGALSLPNMNTSIAVDTTNWVYDGATFNEIKINNATQTISGWLYIIINNASSDDVIVVRYAGSDSGNLTYAQYKSGLSYVSLVAPIMPGVKTYVASRKAFSTIKIYPCLGNV